MLVGPPTLIPREIEAMGCEVAPDIAAIAGADVVYVLRMQQRADAQVRRTCRRCANTPRCWGITPERVRPGQIVMHRGR